MDFQSFRDRLKKDAFGTDPFAVLNPRDRDVFGLVMEILLVETSGRASWENWQRGQLDTLVDQISKRSAFHRERLKAYGKGKRKLGAIPIQTRRDTVAQVKAEGSLIRPADHLQSFPGSTTGSSGTPVNFHSTTINAKYVALRNLAEEFQRGHDFRLNLVRIPLSPKIGQQSAFVEVSSLREDQRPLWHMIDMGRRKIIRFQNCIDRLVDELRKSPVHRLACHPMTMDELLAYGGPKLLTELDVRIWIPYAGHRDFSQDHLFRDAGITIQGNYSSEEFGPMAYECDSCPGHFHVATSNVIIEADDSLTADYNGKTLTRLLITGLHAYATPFIRYDIGDMGILSDACPCGHEGPVLTDIFGRAKQFFVTEDNRLVSFYVHGHVIQHAAHCTEFQFHQRDRKTIVARIGGRESLSDTEKQNVRELVWSATGERFDVEVIACPEIDWSGNTKKLGVTSAVAPDMGP